MEFVSALERSADNEAASANVITNLSITVPSDYYVEVCHIVCACSMAFKEDARRGQGEVEESQDWNVIWVSRVTVDFFHDE